MTIGVNARFLQRGKLEGFGWFSWEVLQRIVAQHPEHEFIFFFDRPYSDEFVFAPNIRPVVLFPPARHPLLFLWWFEWAVANSLKKYRADVFFSPDGFLSLRSAVPTCVVVHDIAHIHFPQYVAWSHRLYYHYMMPLFLKKADAVLTVSEYSKKDILQHYEVKNKDISVCYNGCRQDFKPLSEEEKARIRQKYTNQKPYFLYVGAVHPRKNVHRLIAAFDEFKVKNPHSEHQLLIGGRFAWQVGEVKNAYDAAKNKADIHFLGYVADAELPLLVASAFGLVYVSLFEGFGIPLLEAMNCDVPTITSDTSSMPEVVGEAGLWVNPENVSEIAQAMQRLTSDESLYLSLIEKGQIQRQQFSWQRTSEVVWKKIMTLLQH